MGEEEELPIYAEQVQQNEHGKGICSCCYCVPVHWLRKLAREMHWSFVFGVVIVYGISQGLGGGFARLGTEYYMKEVQKVQPSESQVYLGITNIPWIVKPLWGLLTDVVPILGYRRRPYFILAGFVGVISMLFLSLHKNLHIVFALLLMTAGSAGVAIADVTVDACVAQNSGTHPSLAADMQSLCALSSSIGSLVGFSLSGIFVHLIGPNGVFGLLSIPAGLVLLVGVLLKEPQMPNFAYQQVSLKFLDAAKAMWNTLICPNVWGPCLYMYLSFALSLDIYEGMFYWVTDPEAGPALSKESMGFVMAVGSVGSLLGAVLYQYGLKNHPFRDLLFWTQLLYGLSGMLDLVLVLRLNLQYGIPDYFFVVIDASVSQMIGRLKWMPLLVLSSKLCPPGIEGTFFALLMSIDNAGLMSASWVGGFLLHILNVTRTRFDNLWLAILIRNFLRIAPLTLLFLVPRADPNASILPDEVTSSKEGSEPTVTENVELVSLVKEGDD
ncbi:probable folate-biopterin transporter 2 isoform X1 [Coffea arabica]|uniref:Probable folate-biopterin transporter 2 isoform X1 n=1 Tax=Coffea arabica TaxID=13443 RepID=A0A6P6TWA0_COFAR|nr:probable folate-biopterin transporter 2 [Coffea arabica]XP_027081996.1 probable folate-biopterin transporter 2 [Coffea arabica]